MSIVEGIPMKIRLAQPTTSVRTFKYLILVGACLAIAVAISAHNKVSAAARVQSQIERGRMLVIGGACHDCHTPKKFGPNGPEPDMDRMLSGHPEDIKVSAPYRPAAGSPWVYGVTADLTAWSGPWG